MTEARYIYNGHIHLGESVRLPINTADSASSHPESAEVSGLGSAWFRRTSAVYRRISLCISCLQARPMRDFVHLVSFEIRFTLNGMSPFSLRYFTARICPHLKPRRGHAEAGVDV